MEFYNNVLELSDDNQDDKKTQNNNTVKSNLNKSLSHINQIKNAIDIEQFKDCTIQETEAVLKTLMNKTKDVKTIKLVEEYIEFDGLFPKILTKSQRASYKSNIISGMCSLLLKLDYSKKEAIKKANEYYRALVNHFPGNYWDPLAINDYIYILDEGKFQPKNNISPLEFKYTWDEHDIEHHRIAENEVRIVKDLLDFDNDEIELKKNLQAIKCNAPKKKSLNHNDTSINDNFLEEYEEAKIIKKKPTKSTNDSLKNNEKTLENNEKTKPNKADDNKFKDMNLNLKETNPQDNNPKDNKAKINTPHFKKGLDNLDFSNNSTANNSGNKSDRNRNKIKRISDKQAQTKASDLLNQDLLSKLNLNHRAQKDLKDMLNNFINMRTHEKNPKSKSYSVDNSQNNRKYMSKHREKPWYQQKNKKKERKKHYLRNNNHKYHKEAQDSCTLPSRNSHKSKSYWKKRAHHSPESLSPHKTSKSFFNRSHNDSIQSPLNLTNAPPPRIANSYHHNESYYESPSHSQCYLAHTNSNNITKRKYSQFNSLLNGLLNERNSFNNKNEILKNLSANLNNDPEIIKDPTPIKKKNPVIIDIDDDDDEPILPNEKPQAIGNNNNNNQESNTLCQNTSKRKDSDTSVEYLGSNMTTKSMKNHQLNPSNTSLLTLFSLLKHNDMVEANQNLLFKALAKNILEYSDSDSNSNFITKHRPEKRRANRNSFDPQVYEKVINGMNEHSQSNNLYMNGGHLVSENKNKTIENGELLIRKQPDKSIASNRISRVVRPKSRYSDIFNKKPLINIDPEPEIIRDQERRRNRARRCSLGLTNPKCVLSRSESHNRDNYHYSRSNSRSRSRSKEKKRVNSKDSFGIKTKSTIMQALSTSNTYSSVSLPTRVINGSNKEIPIENLFDSDYSQSNNKNNNENNLSVNIDDNDEKLLQEKYSESNNIQNKSNIQTSTTSGSRSPIKTSIATTITMNTLRCKNDNLIENLFDSESDIENRIQFSDNDSSKFVINNQGDNNKSSEEEKNILSSPIIPLKSYQKNIHRDIEYSSNDINASQHMYTFKRAHNDIPQSNTQMSNFEQKNIEIQPYIRNCNKNQKLKASWILWILGEKRKVEGDGKEEVEGEAEAEGKGKGKKEEEAEAEAEAEEKGKIAKGRGKG